MDTSRADFVGPNDFVRRDADFPLRLTWKYAGAGIPLTGHVIELKIWNVDFTGIDGTPTGAPYLFLDNAGHGGITLDDQGANPGRFYIIITQAQLVALAAGKYAYTVRDLTAGGKTPLFFGLLELGGAIT